MIVSNNWSWWETSATINTCIICLGLTAFWWLYYSRHNCQTKKTAMIDGTNGEKDNNDNGCNNPNCLRCHSSSQHHIKTFQANVTMLRRLVKLEPDLFQGMREEIWSAVEGMENKFEHHQRIIYDDHHPPGWIVGFGTLLTQQFWKKMWKKKNSDEAIESDGRHAAVTDTQKSAIPLSPQQGQNPTVFFVPGLPAIPFHDFNTCQDNNNNCPCTRLWRSFPISKNAPPIPVTGDIEALQRSYHIIRRELLDFLSNSNSQSEEDPFKPFDPKVYTRATRSNTTPTNNNTKQPEWSSIYLCHQGIRQSEICNKYFPQTMNVLEMKCPHIMAGKCGFGSIYFSKLENGTKVKEHCGPTNIRWRCHLPLVVPKSNSAEEEGSSSSSCLRVGLPGVNEKCVGWEEGVPLLFDDSFLHSAVHNHHNGDSNNAREENSDLVANGARVVLIVDFFHPTLSSSDRTALGVLYPPGS